jgi:hypothetical protein
MFNANIMRRLVLPFIGICLCLHVHAQLPDWLQAKVDSVNKALDDFGRNPLWEDADSVDRWNDIARASLMDLLNTPGIGAYPFENALHVTHESSVDGNLILFSLDNNSGGSFVSYSNYLFYRSPDGTEFALELGQDELAPYSVDTVQFESMIFYVWLESSKTCNTCYGWALRCFDPLAVPEEPATLFRLDGRISDNDWQDYDPVTKIVTYGITLNEMISLMSASDLQSLWTDPSRLEVVNTSGGPEYVEHGQFSVRRALMGAPWKE